MWQKLSLFITVLSIITHQVLAQTAVVTPNPYYNVQVTPIDNKGVGVQSFVEGRQGDTILIIGGRTVGLHNFTGAPSFPDSVNNHNIIVFIPSATPGASKTYQMAVPQSLFLPRQYHQLCASNAEYAQSGSILYSVGGYGFSGRNYIHRQRTAIDSFITFNAAYAVDVPQAIRAVISNNPLALSKSITFTQPAPKNDSTLAVTGGELVKMGNYFYLTVGQKFDGEYSTGNFGQFYTCKVTALQFIYAPGNLSYSVVNTFTDPVNLHRRDLNVVPAIISTTGGQAIDILGGVFTPTNAGGPYLNPVEITSSNNQIKQNVNTMVQCFNQYSAAHILMYDASANHMMTTILGGISLFDSVKNIKTGIPPNDTTMPWVNVINTLVRDNTKATPTFTEYASDSNTLPGLIGGVAKFIPYSKFLLAGSDEIIDYSKVKQAAATNNGKVSIGYMFGGIISPSAQTQTYGQSISNVTLYNVTLSILSGPATSKKGKKK